MKYFLVFVLALSTTFFSGLSAAWSDEVELQESTLEPLSVTDQSQKIEFESVKGWSVAVDQVPNLEEMKKALGLSVSDEIRQQIEAKGGQVVEQNPMLAYENMNPEQKARFSEVRRSVLEKVVRVFEKMHGLVGVGIITADGVSFLKKGAMKLVGKGASSNQSVEKPQMTERKQRVLESLLKSIDYKLWYQAPLLIEANEFGLQVTAGVIAESGFMKKGGGGLDEVGLSFAYNVKQKAMVFELFYNSERFDNATMPVFNVGISGKAGVTMASKNESEPTTTSRGTTFYPPAFPGSSSTGSDYFFAGLSSGVGFPPPPLADLLTFTNQFERNALIRITVSPLVKGFVRIHVGDLKKPVQLIGYRFVEVYNAIRSKVQTMRAPSCQSVFAMP